MTGVITTAFGTYREDVVDHIVQFADNNDLPPVTLIGMGLQESGLDVNAVGDVALGGSYGVFQVYLKAHGHDAAYWTGLSGLDNSMAEMRSRWQAAFAQVGSWSAWLADPQGFLELFAPAAQGSIPWTAPMAAQRMGQAIVILTIYYQQLAADTAGCREQLAAAQATIAAVRKAVA